MRFAIPLLILLAQIAPLRAEEPVDVSMVQLVASPEKFDGRAIRVIGFLHLEADGNVLYLHSEDCVYTLIKNSIWVNETPLMKKKFSDRYVLIEGTFDAQDHGFKGLWSGAISKITRVTPWSPKPKKSKKEKESAGSEVEKTRAVLTL